MNDIISREKLRIEITTRIVQLLSIIYTIRTPILINRINTNNKIMKRIGVFTSFIIMSYCALHNIKDIPEAGDFSHMFTMGIPVCIALSDLLSFIGSQLGLKNRHSNKFGRKLSKKRSKKLSKKSKKPRN